jgi:hypothetical protein
MSKHTEFIKNEVREWGEVHLTIPTENLTEVENIAKENNATVKTSNETVETVKVVIKK